MHARKMMGHSMVGWVEPVCFEPADSVREIVDLAAQGVSISRLLPPAVSVFLVGAQIQHSCPFAWMRHVNQMAKDRVPQFMGDEHVGHHGSVFSPPTGPERVHVTAAVIVSGSIKMIGNGSRLAWWKIPSETVTGINSIQGFAYDFTGIGSNLNVDIGVNTDLLIFDALNSKIEHVAHVRDGSFVQCEESWKFSGRNRSFDPIDFLPASGGHFQATNGIRIVGFVMRIKMNHDLFTAV
jgi:hypothetical protein